MFTLSRPRNGIIRVEQARNIHVTAAHRQKQPYHHGDLKAALLAAAEAELGEAGIEGFSLRSVAKRAGVSHAAPAHHFHDVKGLLTALAADGFRRFVATQKAAMAQRPTDPVSQIAASGLGYVRFAQQSPAIFRLIFSSNRPDYENLELAHYARAGYDMLVRQVSELHGSDQWDEAHLRRTIATMWSLAHGLADLLSSGKLKIVSELPQAKQDEEVFAIMRAAAAKA
jgi:AcrR family transcriptional regulator